MFINFFETEHDSRVPFLEIGHNLLITDTEALEIEQIFQEHERIFKIWEEEW